MLSPDQLTKWLEIANRRYSSAGIAHKARPFKAISDLTQDLNCTVNFNSPTAERIFDWF